MLQKNDCNRNCKRKITDGWMNEWMNECIWQEKGPISLKEVEKDGGEWELLQMTESALKGNERMLQRILMNQPSNQLITK